MRIPSLPSRFSPRGALMVFALMLMLVAGLFISATASLMNNRAMQASYLEVAMKRRLAVENSRAFNQQFMLERTFDVNSTVLPGQNGIFANDWGGVNTSTGWSNLRAFSSTSLPGSLSTVFPFNYTGLRPSSSYLATTQTVRPAALPDIDSFTAYAFLKTYAPGLGGDPLVVFRKPTGATDQIEIADKAAGLSLKVSGRMVIRDPDSFFAPSTPNPLEIPVRANSLYIQKHSTTRKIYCKDIVNGEDMVPSNLAAARSTIGPTPETVAAADLYDGSLNVINNASNTDNSLWHIMDREKTAGTGDYVTINSNAPVNASTDPWYIARYDTSDRAHDPPYPPPAYPAGYGQYYNVLYINLDHASLTHMRIYGVVDQIVLMGQGNAAAYANAAALAPVIIATVPNGASPNNFINLQCVNENNRRFVFATQDANHAPLDVYWGSGTSVSATLVRWRMMLVNEYRTITANLPSTITKKVTLTGGVLTNWSFKRRGSGSYDRLTLAGEFDPQPAGAAGSLYSSLIPRDGWMENYFLLVPP